MIIDTHAHYDDEAFDKDREKLLDSMQNRGIEYIVNVGASIASCKTTVGLTRRFPNVYGALGVHPDEVASLTDEDFDWLKHAIYKPKIVAVGEIGLDYHWRQDNKELQKKAFIKQIELANKLGLPVSIHTRDAIDDTIEIIRKYKIKESGVLHCCPFNPELVKQALDAGLYIGFGGTCTFKSSKNAKKIIEMVPADKLLIETDSPYLAPEPVRGTRNDSSNLKYIVEKIAEFKETSPEKIAKMTYENAEKLFIK